MKPLLGAFLLLLLLAGCASAPTPADIAGYYASEIIVLPAPGPQTTAAGPDAATAESFQLYVHPDGHYAAARHRLLYGQPVRGGAVDDLSIQQHSTGSWSVDGDRLLLRSKAERQGTASAQVVRKHQNWYIVWDGVEYAQQPPDYVEGRPDLSSGPDLPAPAPRQATSSADRR